VKVNPDSITLESGFTRDVRQIGHFGTGDLEITIKSDEDFEKAKSLLVKSYEAS
jgi:predicted transport protein